MDQIKIRAVNYSDREELRQFCIRTFTDSYADKNSKENMEKYLSDNFNLEKISSELLNENSEYYFAFSQAGIIAYLKLNFNEAQTELKEKVGVEIERIYVQQDDQGKNIGKTLLDHAIQISEKRKAEYIWLGVWDQNESAIQFYKRNHFYEFGQHQFMLGPEKQTDILMKLILNNL